MATLTTEIASDQTATSGQRVVELSFDDVTPEFALKWARLEANSVEGNAFLSPHFAIPAVTHLAGSYDQKPLILAVESGDGAELVALGLFEVARNSRLLPMTHLQSWRCEHTLFDGLLVDKQTAASALDTLFDWLSQQSHRWQGIAFTDRSADGELNDLLENAAGNSNATWFEDWSSERAVIPVAKVPEDCLQTLYSKSRRRTLKRNAKQLATFGEVSYSLAVKHDTWHRDIEEFLKLEAMGWKGEAGTALLSSPGHANFCREMAACFANDKQLIIYKLLIDDVTAAAAFNMRSADDVFCFKIGWNPEFASGSPGILSELGFLQTCREHFQDICMVDSCSKSGSYVEDVWPWKRRLTTGVFTTTRTGTLAANAMTQLKRLKRMLKKA